MGVSRSHRTGPIAVRVAAACTLACFAACLVPSAAAIARPARASRLVAAFDGRSGTPSPATRHALARLRLELGQPVFRGHENWNIWEIEARGGGVTRDAVAQLERAPGVRWAEQDAALSYDSSAPASSSLAGTPFGPLVAPDLSAPMKATGATRTASTETAATAPLTASPCTTPGSSCAAPPTSCAPGSADGLDAGQANDPLFCNESNGPYYAEEWNNFCFLPQTQLASVTAGAPKAPGSSGTCNTGAWNLGAQGQGTVIAILDSGVNYYHQDLKNQMVDTTNDPLLSDPNFPGAIHGWNFYDDNPDPMDYFGHGTGRAGLAAAEANNTDAGCPCGMAGASPKSLLMAGQVGRTHVLQPKKPA